jgi:hypothetical protein
VLQSIGSQLGQTTEAADIGDAITYILSQPRYLAANKTLIASPNSSRNRPPGERVHQLHMWPDELRPATHSHIWSRSLPLAGSLAVLTLADLDVLAATAPGRYVLTQMPPSAPAVRLAGDALMGLGARRRHVALILVGTAIIAASWSHAVWPKRPRA